MVALVDQSTVIAHSSIAGGPKLSPSSSCWSFTRVLHIGKSSFGDGLSSSVVKFVLDDVENKRAVGFVDICVD